MSDKELDLSVYELRISKIYIDEGKLTFVIDFK